MPQRLRFIGRAISLFFRLFIVRSFKVMFLPGFGPKGKTALAPPVVKRLENRPQIVAGASLVFLFLLVNLLYLLDTDPVQHAHYALYVVLGVLVICLLILRWSKNEITALTREAAADGYRLCPHCGYNLRGLPDQHRCPECGNPFDIEDVKEKWTAYLAANPAGAGESASAPPILARLERWRRGFRTTAVSPVLLLAGTLLLHGKLLTPADPITRICIYLSLLFISAGMLLAAWMSRNINRLITQAHKTKYALCIECGYYLAGLPDQHRCPECGTPYEIEQVRRRWAEYLASRAAKELPW